MKECGLNIVWFIRVIYAVFIGTSFWSLIYKLRTKGETLAFLSLHYSKYTYIYLNESPK